MIKLTVLHYTMKPEALERRHKISEHYAKLIYEWEENMNTVQDVAQEYIERPFIEPFEFEEDDYNVQELNLRVRTDDIIFYKENTDGLVEITIEGGVTFTIKESIETIDGYFDNTK